MQLSIDYFSKSKFAFSNKLIYQTWPIELTYHNFLIFIDKLANKVNEATQMDYPKNSLKNEITTQDYETNVQQISMYRLCELKQRFNQDPSDINLFDRTVVNFWKTFKRIKELDNSYHQTYLLSLLINVSRGFLEIENVRSSVKNCNDLLEGNMISILIIDPSENCNVLITKSKNLLHQIIDSKRFAFYLNKFIQYYSLKVVDNLIEKLHQMLEDKIIFLKNIMQYGMIGKNMFVFLNYDFIENSVIEEEELSGINFVISTLIHEIGHQIIRILNDDTFELTPRKEQSEEQFEAGYEFERMMFGTVVMENDNEPFLSDLANWRDCRNCIFPEIIQKKYRLASKGMNFFRSGYSWIPKIIYFK